VGDRKISRLNSTTRNHEGFRKWSEDRESAEKRKRGTKRGVQKPKTKKSRALRVQCFELVFSQGFLASEFILSFSRFRSSALPRLKISIQLAAAATGGET
jgi:hypothetical protein